MAETHSHLPDYFVYCGSNKYCYIFVSKFQLTYVSNTLNSIKHESHCTFYNVIIVHVDACLMINNVLLVEKQIKCKILNQTPGGSFQMRLTYIQIVFEDLTHL